MFWKKLRLPRFTLPRINWRPNREVVRKGAWFGLLMAGLFGAFCWGRYGISSQVHGQTPQSGLPGTLFQNTTPSERGRHVVAYIYGNIPITREELGDYLVDRVGAERLEFLVNRRIIERACEAMNVRITDAEIKAQLAEDLRTFGNISESEFVNKILKKYNKTMFEWKEDVIRPKLALQRVVKDKVASLISEQDIQDAFEATYGPKVECRIIVIPQEMTNKKDELWSQARADFKKAAADQPIKQFASVNGEVPPIHKHFADRAIEDAAFKLQVGETSPLIFMPDKSMVILHCDKLIAPDPNKKLSEERPTLYRQVYEARLTQELPKLFNSMRQAANPQIFLRPDYVMPDAASMANPGQLQQMSADIK